MDLKKLITLCNPVKVSGPEPHDLGALTHNSRAVEENGVFIALQGTRVDGHAFINDAIDNGAAVIISEKKVRSDGNVCRLLVDDTRSLMGPLAQAFEGNPAEKLTIVGITGTNGKTTVATLTYQVLQSLGTKPSLLGTIAKRIDDKVLDSRLTTADPIELARDMRRMVEAGSTHLVMEVSSHALDQQRVDGIAFNVAAFTNLSHDHLDYHPSMEAYANSKKRLFDGLKTQATAVINDDDEWAPLMSRDCMAKKLLFGFENMSPIDCRILKNSHQGLTIEVDDMIIQSPLVGKFNAYNIAQTYLICQALGFNSKKIADAIADAPGASGRLQRVEIEDKAHQPLVLVDYAHTPGALKNVLETLVNLKESKQKLHVIFGCGGDRDKTKRPEMAEIAENYADRVIITSDNPRSEDPDAIIDDAMKGFRHPDQVQRITDRREAIEQTINEADEDTIILIAGKGHETYQEINGEQLPFDDREVAVHALANRNGNLKSPEVC
ncbi:MAG TPA: UDP-N-acetylmuramoyl-L-alanyl-D-glutamate--2,6-diaminopimelate ligase [Balneolaceae bacterium]|nr:UDP-N-acetylmuramoyl-L-alanyl-D-glutamate--2,6-diaminopimelate ligase [Balneolaceae bacterium]